MAILKKYDVEGKEVGEVTIEDDILEVANSQMIKDYLVAIHKNARQWSANTKGRKEIQCTGAKPHKQKGLGKARQGTYAAPQYRGGGVVFGPKPKFDQHVRINKKERRKAIKSLMSEKIKDNNVFIFSLEKDEISKTKQMANFLKTLKIDKTRVLFLANDGSYNNLRRSLKNIQKKEFVNFSRLNGYNLALCKNVILIESAIEELKGVLNG